MDSPEDKSQNENHGDAESRSENEVLKPEDEEEDQASVQNDDDEKEDEIDDLEDEEESVDDSEDETDADHEVEESEDDSGKAPIVFTYVNFFFEFHDASVELIQF
ncbi:RING/FYVE/PHD zinc finger superfamily protein [Actinidia rufa]|uniref:RING/FYVE/PHD zinc finger superfamily protein n=1 Tax=Actinidia rufa TaxID=165716 RepID=A0A7J0F8N3_9ERIC|nr:RING/FYVE/PHD zinc finger superfamily protein [Actinidia rufa]